MFRWGRRRRRSGKKQALAGMMNALTLRHAHTVPAILANAGENAATKFLEFFAARIRNLNTREAYARACAQFLAWSEQHLDDIRLITPMHVAAYIEQHPGSPQTIKQHLAAIKMLFDYLVVSQIVPVNPAAPVKGPTHVVKRGKTPVLSVRGCPDASSFHSDRFAAGFAGPGPDRRHALFLCEGFGGPWDEGFGLLRKWAPALVPAVRKRRQTSRGAGAPQGPGLRGRVSGKSGF
jgi:hypothetical protein